MNSVYSRYLLSVLAALPLLFQTASAEIFGQFDQQTDIKLRAVSDSRVPVNATNRRMAAQTARDSAPVAMQGGAIELELGKGTLVRLRQPAATVFIANPDTADIQVKSPSLIYVFAKAPGETTLYAVDENERPIYSGMVRVTANPGRSCSAAASPRPPMPRMPARLPRSSRSRASSGLSSIDCR